jgi:hypothetical protein
MKSVILTAAAALLAGTALAVAQSGGNMGNHSQGAAPAPAAQQQAPADKMAPAAQNKSAQPAQTTGQAPKADADAKAGAQMNNEAPKANTDVKAQSDTKMDAGKAASGKADDKAKAAADTKSKSMDTKATADTKNNKMDSKAAAEQKNGKSSAQTDSKNSSTTGQGAAGAKGAANLSTEQRTKIRTVIKEKVHARPLTNVNFSISVGTAVPRSVHFYPVPVEIVEVYPAWRGYNFILVNDQIVIIDPSSYMIVAIIV